jgi:putative glutamine amidotransferase
MTRHPDVADDDRAIVAVTATVRTEDGIGRLRLPAAYLDVLERAGFVPIVLPPFAGAPEVVAAAVGRVLDVVDGLVLTGGEDVDPARYGVSPNAHLGVTNAARDATEIAAVMGARQRLLPTLAICRGIQVLNVALGGTLLQDIPSQRPGTLLHDPDASPDARTHPVRLVEGSRAARALSATTVAVNSRHHQAIDRLAVDLTVTGTAPDGIIEAVETRDDDSWWVMAVQWHPEEFVRDREAADHGLFAAFAAAIRRAAVAVP